MESRDLRRYAPLGLYIAGLALLAAGGLYIVQREFSLAVQISLALVVLGLAAFALLDPERVRRALTGRQARYGSNALVLVLAFLGILIVVNYLVVQNSQRWDLTEDQQFTLAPETLETLQALPEPVHAQAFFTARRSPEQAENLLEQYEFRSNGRFTYEFIDPDVDPVAAQQAEIAQDGTVVLSMGDQSQQVTIVTEQELTGGLVRLINPEERKVYFLTGHGEKDPNGTGENAYSIARRILVSKNYTVESLNLLAENAIPQDAQLIVVAGPTQPLTADEVSLISAYLDAGGALIVMEEPLPVTDFGEAADPLADYLAENWGLQPGIDIIVDLSSNQPFVAVGSQYGSSPIVNDLQGLATLFPTARSVSVTAAANGSSPVTLVSTSSQAWAETDLEAIQNQNAQVEPNEGVDIIGPVPLAGASENFASGARVVVIGDSEFATDLNFTAYGNGDLFINAVDWAIGQEQLISLTPKSNTQRLLLPPQATTMNLILLGTVFVIPGLVLLSGGIVWWQKRRRG